MTISLLRHGSQSRNYQNTPLPTFQTPRHMPYRRSTINAGSAILIGVDQIVNYIGCALDCIFTLGLPI